MSILIRAPRLACICLCLALKAQDPGLFVEAVMRLQRGDPASANDLLAGSPIRTAAMALDPVRSPEQSRFAAASWLWLANMKQGFHFGEDKSYLQAARNQADLVKAWTLLDSIGPDLRRSSDEIRLEIAWRLLDLARMRQAYASVSARHPLNLRELVHCLLVAAHLGEWEAAQHDTDQLRQQGTGLDGFHRMAEQNLTSFDYQSLLEAIHLGHPGPITHPLAVRSWRISHWRTRVKSLASTDKSMAQTLSSAPRSWIDKPPPRVELLQVGAAAHWIESSMQPPVSGFMGEGRLFLVGYRDVPGPPGEAGRQDQVWDLHQDPQHPAHWTGTNTLTGRLSGTAPTSVPAFQMVLEVEWDMNAAEDYPDAPPVSNLQTPTAPPMPPR